MKKKKECKSEYCRVRVASSSLSEILRVITLPLFPPAFLCTSSSPQPLPSTNLFDDYISFSSLLVLSQVRFSYHSIFIVPFLMLKCLSHRITLCYFPYKLHDIVTVVYFSRCSSCCNILLKINMTYIKKGSFLELLGTFYAHIFSSRILGYIMLCVFLLPEYLSRCLSCS